jgi:organic hydroperoxide reductase OsmC/OhrA
MSGTRVHQATVVWEVGKSDLRAHTVRMADQTVPGSCAPAYGGDPSKADPEELFVAALSACHMLWFLDFARRARLRPLSYTDSPQGTLESARIVKVLLRPSVVFATAVTAHVLDELHHRAHEACFIARSVTCEVVIDSRHGLPAQTSGLANLPADFVNNT